jgi:hypothetical protein
MTADQTAPSAADNREQAMDQALNMALDRVFTRWRQVDSFSLQLLS